MKKKLTLDKTRISKLTNLNVIVGGTGTLQDPDTNPPDTGSPDTNTDDTQTNNETIPTSGGIPTKPLGNAGGSGIDCTKKKITTSKLC